FIQHTSAAITINEAADPDVLTDFESVFNHIVPENLPFLVHTMEGPDDMPAHIKAAMIGHSITVPITDGRLNLGTWQGIYLCEFRNRASGRRLVATVY
ncbi:secondary thiamine-phosphate synthase enzyme YjbQ, partial [Neolewinella agarilytica]